MLSLIGLVTALLLLMWVTLRGANPLFAAPACALLVAFSGGLDVFPGEASQANYIESYMAGFTSFIGSWFFMFLLGSIFGKLMEDSGAAHSVAEWILGKFGTQRAPLAVVLACAILTYGGVSVFIVAFSVYPVAVELFQQANLPRRFIPACLAFGSATFTMTSAGSPEIQNWIPIKFLNTTPYAAWEVSIVVALVMAGLGYFLLSRMVATAVANNESFASRFDDPQPDQRHLPHPIAALLPLVAVLLVSFLFHDSLKQYALVLALLAGCICVAVINISFFKHPAAALSAGAMGALIAIGNTAAVVGFGSVAKASPAFDLTVSWLTQLPGNELVGASVAVTVICALTGSASGGQAIALPAIAPHYLELGVDPAELHRTVAIASGGLDSLPHNGYVVTTIRAICGENYQTAYPPVAIVTVLVPLVGMLVALTLFSIF
ncbi:MAG: GntP family permease [Pseudomonadales bacterium]